MSTIIICLSSDKSPLFEKLHFLITPCIVAMFLAGGSYLAAIPPPAIPTVAKNTPIKTALVFKEETTPVKQIRKTVPKKPVDPKQPVDRTIKPILKQSVITPQPEKTAYAKKVRRVYGLRKVYSSGLGTGGNLSDAIVAKLGNTIDKEIDTITATATDIKGRIASTTTVTTPPQFRKCIKPAYTNTMREHQVAGKVNARVLVDVDGKAKKIVITHDLGFGTREASIDAINQMLFEPAKINNDPVAVWIPLTFRFEFSV